MTELTIGFSDPDAPLASGVHSRNAWGHKETTRGGVLWPLLIT